ncbi:1-acyl-sn-glycerol-3-phosphate acyltransferase [Mycobacterium sp. ITM-2016-00318]|uniref:1-acyl-sn-glycerol-3-phosphate acyltransferase n=1 Tax=Mycobacterium sp. ITM-2016-00318 TaxID=2099693 RepID=UPI000CF8E839|nr:1-acyl-sn-glycerol-3-phosphate acyltransferase [Mycobacterium sp. ITM-2016-00318]WNG93890.1 1-acyl-sn-glycerol-3-phosphate acyltransferase [Mycobacterium sp. ITM-2016-00318]
MTALRRAITMPLMAIVMVSLLALGPVLLLGSGVVAIAVRSSRPPRTVALTMAYALIELRAMTQVLRGNRDCDQMVHDFLVSAEVAVRRILDVEVVLEPGSATPDATPRDVPLIVLSRHCGPGDSVLVAWLLAIRYRMQLRVVLKAVLRCEPLLDLAGDWGCLCFLARGDRARTQIRLLAESLTGGQAMLLFPEGANFSWPRWRDAIHRLRSTGNLRAAGRALRQSHTLPPRSGGAAAAVAGAPNANLLVLTHNGFCADGRARPWWQLPVHRQLLVRTVVVPAIEVPPPQELARWLDRTWTRVDTWVAAHAEQP